MRKGDRRRGALWIAVTVATATAGLLGSLGHLGWWLELFSHFRLQYAVLLAVCAAMLLASRRPVAGLLALGLALANALPLVHHFAPRDESAAAGPGMRALLVNVWFRNDDHERVLDYVRSKDPDVAVFLEVTPAWDVALRRLDRLPHQALAGDVLVASRQPLARLRTVSLADGGSWAIAFSYDVAGTPVTVIGAHANWPLGAAISASRDRELLDLGVLASSVPRPVLLMGDFNTTAFSPVFAQLLAASGLRDCAAGRGFVPTWPALFPPLLMQIDHCLASPGLTVARLGSGPYVGSDHFPLEADLVLPGTGAATLRASAALPTFRR